MDSTFSTHFPPSPKKSERKYIDKSEGGRGCEVKTKPFKDMKGNETTKSSLGDEGEKVRRFHRLLSSVYLKAFGCSISCGCCFVGNGASRFHLNFLLPILSLCLSVYLCWGASVLCCE
jgi:hypothetical protein